MLEVTIYFVAAPNVPVAENVTGVRPILVAVKVFGPTAAPKVQLVTFAIPNELVVAEPPITLPPPLATANVTLTPLAGLLLTSFTITLGAIATACPAKADWPSPAFIAICVAGPAIGVILPVTPVNKPASVAVIV